MSIGKNYQIPIANIFGLTTGDTPVSTDLSTDCMATTGISSMPPLFDYGYGQGTDVSAYVPSLPDMLGGMLPGNDGSMQLTSNTGSTGGFFNFPQLQMPDFSGLKFKFSLTSESSSSGSSLSSSSGSSSSSTNYNIDNSAVKNLSWWKAQGYNEEAGKRLAANTKKRSDELFNAGITGQCGMGVRGGINDTYYGGNNNTLKVETGANGKKKARYEGSQHYQSFGYAKDTGTSYLSQDSHLKKIDVRGMHLTKNDIPAGAIIIYEAGYSSGSNSHCGHIEVSDGNGHGYSDYTSTLLQNYGARKEPKEIWLPV